MRLGINGFGRIGRMVLKAIYDHNFHSKEEAFCITGINDGANAQTMAHLLKYDSLHGIWNQQVSSDTGHLIINDVKIPVSQTRNPSDIPWDQWGVEFVLECTGALKTKADLQKHLKGQVKKVLISAPAKGSDITICYGVNHAQYDPQQHHLVSNASCTTNCLAPVIEVLDRNFGVASGFMTTVHAYTNDQRLLDGNHKDLRRARGASLSIIPTTTGAAQTVGKILPHLKGKIDGISVRVPTPNVSLVDFVAHLKNNASIRTINQAFEKAAHSDLKGILAVENLPLVSRDYLGHTASAIVELPSTMLIQDRMVKVLAWYDNEVGFSHRMVDLLKILGRV